MNARRRQRRSSRGGFTLVEILVVIGIIAILIGILMPTLSNARRHAKSVQCQSNLRQVGQALVMYANVWKGWVFPPEVGSAHPREMRLPVHVFKPAVWNPPVMKCPADDLPPPPPVFDAANYENGDENGADHSYIFNYHIVMRNIKVGSRDFGGLSASDIIVAGEKRTDKDDYYMAPGNFPGHIEQYRHGLQRGSNYLYLDWHVATQMPKEAKAGIDPWDVPKPPEPQPPPTP